ncbi:poly-gamma-glutamate hydrolase family protein [Dactylosporangium sp. CA-139066]|uniref:poly-gamma-glutamate hydrolase family protein n=1 Tax=Dactylosporangium sp. CA-139066 TaxID=3239930 RepID=UPI003D8DDB6B
MGISRRVMLAAGGAALAAPAFGARVAAAADTYPSNTALYADPALVAGVDYGQRFRRHGVSDDSETAPSPALPAAVVIAPHGGGIEPGTSELCLAIAGYDPATMAATPAGGPVYDFWMFEGLRASNNGVLHVTSTHCDDPVALALCGGVRRAVSLHGCTPQQAGFADGTAAALVGGADAALRSALRSALSAAGFTTRDAAGVGELDGDDPANIANRTLSGGGAQLELTTPLRQAMFTSFTRAGRRTSTTGLFWSFTAAVRSALAAV